MSKELRPVIAEACEGNTIFSKSGLINTPR